MFIGKKNISLKKMHYFRIKDVDYTIINTGYENRFLKLYNDERAPIQDIIDELSDDNEYMGLLFNGDLLDGDIPQEIKHMIKELPTSGIIFKSNNIQDSLFILETIVNVVEMHELMGCCAVSSVYDIKQLDDEVIKVLILVLDTESG